MRSVVVCVLLACAADCIAWSVLRSHEARGLGLEPGPLVKATQGQVWPKPQTQILFNRYMTVDRKNFNFLVTGEICPIITEAITRYESTLRRMQRHLRKARKLWPASQVKQNQLNKATGTLPSLHINLTYPCEVLPYLNMDERYTLRVNSLDLPDAAQLTSESVWGILRGLETFVQLLYSSESGTELLVQGTLIQDFPRFPHRGLHLDTARHFIPLRVILTVLDGMAINKLNVFHWHLVDDQSFPYESSAWPDLSARGAYSPLHVYTAADVARVVEAARFRGIRVIAEFDTPGHTRSWGIAYPELLTPCYDTQRVPDGSLGPMHPLRNNTYSFMASLLKELVQVFPDQFIHLGGDEVPFDCWLSNPEIVEYIDENGMTIEELEEIYIKQIIDTADALNATPIVWQEVFDNGVRIPENTIVHVWKDWIDYMGEVANITRAGYSTILSSCWYLDHLSTGGDWQKFYNCDPSFFPGSELAHRRVLGGEACMWAEVADATNVLTRIWPRASAAAEKLWSSAAVADIDDAAARLEEHACRMNQRGIPAQPPNGPGFCPFQLYA